MCVRSSPQAELVREGWGGLWLEPKVGLVGADCENKEALGRS